MLYRTSYYVKHPLALWKELVWHPIKYFIYRLRHGFDIRDTWSLDYALAKWILPRLKKFKQVKDGWPGRENDPNCDTPEHWNQTLDKMIWSFEDIVAEEELWKEWYKINKNDYAANDLQRREGLELFGKYFQCLWW